MTAATYISSDDSLLLRKAIANETGKKFLEIGVGYGSTLKSISGRFLLTVGTDIQRTAAFDFAQSVGVELLLADRASCFRASVFDLVVMNPPYLPSEKIEDLSTDGGPAGFEVPRLFVEEAMRVLKPDGKALIVLSSETDLERFVDYCERNSLILKPVLERKLFFETIFVFEFRKIKQARTIGDSYS